MISTVVGDGVGASSGNGVPARGFSVDAPAGLAIDAFGNLLFTSRTAARLVVAGDDGIPTGDDAVLTLYWAPPRDTFPASVTSCLTGIAPSETADHVRVTDACAGLVIELTRQ